MKSGSSLLFKMYSYFVQFLNLLFSCYIILWDQKASNQYFVFFCTKKETGSFELFSLFLFADALAAPSPNPGPSQNDQLIFPWLGPPAFLSATSSSIFLTINPNSCQTSHSQCSGNTCVLLSLPWSLHLEVFIPFSKFLLLC